MFFVVLGFTIKFGQTCSIQSLSVEPLEITIVLATIKTSNSFETFLPEELGIFKFCINYYLMNIGRNATK